jgi:hypothetical protein
MQTCGKKMFSEPRVPIVFRKRCPANKVRAFPTSKSNPVHLHTDTIVLEELVVLQVAAFCETLVRMYQNTRCHSPQYFFILNASSLNICMQVRSAHACLGPASERHTTLRHLARTEATRLTSSVALCVRST